MSTNTAENVFKLIEELPSVERVKLNELLTHPPSESVKTKAPLDKRVPCQPMPDRSREHEWVKEHKQEYAGQWVALDGDRLVAASNQRLDISAAVKAAGVKLPLILRVPAPDDLPYLGI